jgi:hypothetical protein
MAPASKVRHTRLLTAFLRTDSRARLRGHCEGSRTGDGSSGRCDGYRSCYRAAGDSGGYLSIGIDRKGSRGHTAESYAGRLCKTSAGNHHAGSNLAAGRREARDRRRHVETQVFTAEKVRRVLHGNRRNMPLFAINASTRWTGEKGLLGTLGITSEAFLRSRNEQSDFRSSTMANV